MNNQTDNAPLMEGASVIISDPCDLLEEMQIVEVRNDT